MWHFGSDLGGGTPQPKPSEAPSVRSVEASSEESTNEGKKAEPSFDTVFNAVSERITSSKSSSAIQKSSLLASVSDAVFSPTTTEDWLRCPMYRKLKKEWRPLGEKSHDVSLLLGRAIHAGAAAFYDPKRSDPSVADDAIEAALTTLHDEFEEDGEHTVEGLEKLVRRGMNALIDADPLAGEKVMAVELPVGETKIDAVSRKGASFSQPFGTIVTTDWKVRRHLKSEWLSREFRDFEASWQLRHEAWAAEEYYGEPVGTARAVLIVLAPKVKVIPYDVEIWPEKLLRWLRSAKTVWREMAAIEPYMRTSGCGMYGGCTFHDFCHALGGDEKRAEALYERIER